jgi:hypothetical protein
MGVMLAGLSVMSAGQALVHDKCARCVPPVAIEARHAAEPALAARAVVRASVTRCWGARALSHHVMFDLRA